MKKEDIYEIIVRNCCEVISELEKHTFQLSDCLNDLGANSMDRAEIITMTLESLSLQIPRVEVLGARNIGEFVDVLYEKSNSI